MTLDLHKSNRTEDKIVKHMVLKKSAQKFHGSAEVHVYSLLKLEVLHCIGLNLYNKRVKML